MKLLKIAIAAVAAVSACGFAAGVVKNSEKIGEKTKAIVGKALVLPKVALDFVLEVASISMALILSAFLVTVPLAIMYPKFRLYCLAIVVVHSIAFILTNLYAKFYQAGVEGDQYVY